MLVKGDDFRKKRVFGVKIGKSIIGKRVNEVLPVFRKIFEIKRESYSKDLIENRILPCGKEDLKGDNRAGNLEMIEILE